MSLYLKYMTFDDVNITILKEYKTYVKIKFKSNVCEAFEEPLWHSAILWNSFLKLLNTRKLDSLCC